MRCRRYPKSPNKQTKKKKQKTPNLQPFNYSTRYTVSRYILPISFHIQNISQTFFCYFKRTVHRLSSLNALSPVAFDTYLPNYLQLLSPRQWLMLIRAGISYNSPCPQCPTNKRYQVLIVAVVSSQDLAYSQWYVNICPTKKAEVCQKSWFRNNASILFEPTSSMTHKGVQES